MDTTNQGVHRFFLRVLAVVLAVLVIGSAESREAVVVRVRDGDSFTVRLGPRRDEVRLYGIDCPEHDQHYGAEAKALTRRLINRRQVELVEVERDRYGRMVALVRCRGRLINEELVARGLAWVSPRYCRAKPLCTMLKQRQQEARKGRLGLWRQRHPTAPWRWKHRRH